MENLDVLKTLVVVLVAFSSGFGKGYAQSPQNDNNNLSLPSRDSMQLNLEPRLAAPSLSPTFMASPALTPTFSQAESRQPLPEKLLFDVSELRNGLPHKYIYQPGSTLNFAPMGPFAFSAAADEQFYVGLMATRSAALAAQYQYNNFTVGTQFLINRYELRQPLTQLGVSGFMDYQFSPNWSMHVWGTFYSNNPYYNMATFPYVATNSYGGWMRYQGEKFGIKLGAQRYYDTFMQQWKTEPIVTPMIRVSRKFIIELPVGPMVQQAMESILREKSEAPMLVPEFRR